MLKKIVVLLAFVAVAHIRVASTQEYLGEVEIAELPSNLEESAEESSSSAPVTTHTLIPSNTTHSSTPSTTAMDDHGAHFDVGSFLGGILVGAVVVVVVYLIYYFAYARKHAQGHSYEHFG